jgi:DNA segregation ATPase FtsK/SpoIIIE-like protein
MFEYVSPMSNIENLSRRFSGWSNGFIDYDNDGWKDIYSANGDVDYFEPNARQHDTIFRNLDGNSFINVSESLGKDFLRMGFQRGSAFGDLNNDGFLDLVVTTRQASISMIQRRLRVGYNRAARMIEQMEEEGIVSPMESGKPREVLRERGERQWPERG